jgi:hypothetical protein
LNWLPFPEQLKLTAPQVIMPVHADVPENVIELSVAAQVSPVVVQAPLHDDPATDTVTTSVPSALTSSDTVAVNVPTVVAVFHVPTIGLTNGWLHPIPGAASTRSTSKLVVRIVEVSSSAVNGRSLMVA